MRRRDVLFSAAAALSIGSRRILGANERVQVGLVGLGGRGTDHLNTYLKLADAEVTAICDVDDNAMERAQSRIAKSGRKPVRQFTDMRKLFELKEVDAVSLPLPNHWHALASIWAMQAGKDVYCEKPACHDPFEGQQMIQAARKYNRMLQIGSQGRTMPHKIEGIKLLHDGGIGQVYMARGLCFKRRKSIGHKPDGPVPPGVNWDLFLGPAPMRPFNELRFKYNWHWFWDTGNGDIGNQGVHEMGVARWGLGDPEWPKTAFAQGGKYAYNDDQETPNTLLASFDYGGREIVFEVRGLLTGSEGARVPGRPGQAAAEGAVAAPNAPAPTSTAPINAPPMNIMIGNLFYGTEGWAAMSDAGFQ